MFENVTILDILIAVGGLFGAIFSKDMLNFLRDIWKAYTHRKNSNVDELEKKIVQLELECNLKDQRNMTLEKEFLEVNYKLKYMIPALRTIKDETERNKMLDILDPRERHNITSA